MTTPNRIPQEFTFVEEDPELGNMPPRDAWSLLVQRLEVLADDEVLVRCEVGHSWKAKRTETRFDPPTCPEPTCDCPPVLTMTRKSIETLRALAALPDGHRLGRCAEGHQWDADDETPLAVRPEPPKLLRSSDGRWDPLESTCRHASLSIL